MVKMHFIIHFEHSEAWCKSVAAFSWFYMYSFCCSLYLPSIHR